MNALVASSAALALLLAIGHATGGHRFVFRAMADADFDPLAKRTMVFVWHLSTLLLFMTAGGLGFAAWRGGGEALLGYLVVQTLALALIQFATGATSGIPGWIYKMPQWAVFALIGGLAAAGAV